MDAFSELYSLYGVVEYALKDLGIHEFSAVTGYDLYADGYRVLMCIHELIVLFKYTKLKFFNEIVFGEKDYESTRTITIDGKEIINKEQLIRKFYDHLGCPKSFGLNRDAFIDTLKDTQFWIKEKLCIQFVNYDKIFSGNLKERTILSDIIVSLLQGRYGSYQINIR